MNKYIFSLYFINERRKVALPAEYLQENKPEIQEGHMPHVKANGLY